MNVPECKYCLDEICVNNKSPMCANFCPVVDYPEVCRYEDRINSMTNGDRIRAMTDEELAEHFALLFIDTREGVAYSTDEDRWLEWLQQPVKGER